MRGLLLLTISICTSLCVAQNTDDKKKLSIGFSEGYGIPTSNFAKSDQSKFPISKLTKQDTNHLGGYALHGFHYELYASYKVKPHLSVMLSVSGNDIGYNTAALNSQYIQFFPPNTTSINAYNNYSIIQYLIGPYYNIPLGHGLSIELKALAGLTSSNYPSLTYLGLPELEIYTFPQGHGFGYNLGTGIKYITADGYIGLHLNINYAGSSINFSNYTLSSFNPTSGRYISSIVINSPENLAMKLFQVSAGISFEL